MVKQPGSGAASPFFDLTVRKDKEKPKATYAAGE
jgi:hypothetical protein